MLYMVYNIYHQYTPNVRYIPYMDPMGMAFPIHYPLELFVT